MQLDIVLRTQDEHVWLGEDKYRVVQQLAACERLISFDILKGAGFAGGTGDF
jgi:hypothetical protein